MDNDFFSAPEDSQEETEFQPLPQRIRECLSIESEDAMVRKIQSCLRDVLNKNKNIEASLNSKKSQWHTW